MVFYGFLIAYPSLRYYDDMCYIFNNLDWLSTIIISTITYILSVILCFIKKKEVEKLEDTIKLVSSLPGLAIKHHKRYLEIIGVKIRKPKKKDFLLLIHSSCWTIHLSLWLPLLYVTSELLILIILYSVTANIVLIDM